MENKKTLSRMALINYLDYPTPKMKGIILFCQKCGMFRAFKELNNKLICVGCGWASREEIKNE